MDDRSDGPVALSKSITTSVGLPGPPWWPIIGGELEPGTLWDIERPPCRNRLRRSDENRLLGLRACCTKAKMSFNRLLLRFPETRPVGSTPPAARRSPLPPAPLPVDRILANGTLPLKELLNPLPPGPPPPFDMLPSVELIEVCRSTTTGSAGCWTATVAAAATVVTVG